MRARADVLAFAFDDDVFYPQALEQLMAEAARYPQAVCYGSVEWTHRDPATGEIVRARLGGGQSQDALRAGNFVPNNGVLLRRSVIDEVGFYDPHVLLARVCDWDLWRRIAARFELKCVDVLTAQVDGNIVGDSLFATYDLDAWATEEWMRTERNHRLTPQAMPDYDVTAVDHAHARSTQAACVSLARRHGSQRSWPVERHHAVDNFAVLVVVTDYDASTSLCFDLLGEPFSGRIRIVVYPGTVQPEDLARATCVVFVRRMSPFRPLIRIAKTIGVPIYYYLDDNLIVLAEAGEIVIPGEDFTRDSVRSFLEAFDGVLLTSPSLVDYFSTHGLHPRVALYPPGCADQRSVAAPRPSGRREFVVACLSGSHRRQSLWDSVVPALKAIAASGRPVHLVAGAAAGASTVEGAFRVTELPYDSGYSSTIRRFAGFAPDVLVHGPARSANDRYKTHNVLLNAHLLNAVAVLPDSAPYDELRGTGAALLVRKAGEPESWRVLLEDVLAGSVDVDEVKRANARYCEAHFSGAANREVLSQIAVRHEHGPNAWEQDQRLRRLLRWLRTTEAASRTVQSPDALSGPPRLSAYGLQLARRVVRRLLRRPSGLSFPLDPAFVALAMDSELNGWKRRSSVLDLSRSLAAVPFMEYRLRLRGGRLRGVSVVFAGEHAAGGTAGIEWVSPREAIAAREEVPLDSLDSTRPATFTFASIDVAPGSLWRLRVFARASGPVYVYEFVDRRLLPVWRPRRTPFVRLLWE